MFVHNLDPILVNIPLPFTDLVLPIRWYSLAYLLGFFILVWSMQYYRKKGVVKLSEDDVWDLGYYSLLGVIIGSRLFEVLVWSPKYYLSNPIKILYIWEGGLAFHGGLIGIICAVWYFSKKHKIGFLKLADLIAAPMAVALGFGRIANFINGELWGPPTDVAWCFQYGEFCRHPYQLYSVVKHWFLAGVLFVLGKKKHKDGEIFMHFVWMYGLLRFLLDFYRDDSWYMTLGLSTGQWSSLVMLVLGLYGLYSVKKS